MDRRTGKKVRACGDGDKGKEAEGLMIEIDLPTGMIMEILSWLPFKPLLNCRCVCKTWYQIISDPHFAKLHLSRSPISILIQNGDQVLLPDPRIPKGSRESRYLRINQIVKTTDRGWINIEETIFFPGLNIPDSSFKLVNSCNGLVFLCGFGRNLVYVCNPVLGEFITIRVPEGDKRVCKDFCFGFNVKTNQYKVVQTFYVNGEGRKAEVYTLGTGSWTNLGNAPFSIGCMRFNTFLHGACHWVEYSYVQKIACFDFEKDLFREVPSPPQYKPWRGDDSLRLGVIEDSLCASYYLDDDSFTFDIWVMKDYGVKESWTPQFRVKRYESLFDINDYCYLLMLLMDGRMLLSYNERDVVCYNLKTKNFQKTDIFSISDHFFIVAYTPCFVSLKDVAKGEQISRFTDPAAQMIY